MTKLPDGWTESHQGGLVCSGHPLTGGIIDSEIVSGKWFVIFNDDSIDSINELATRDDALDAARAAFETRAEHKRERYSRDTQA